MNEPTGWYRRIVTRLAEPQTPPPWTVGETVALLVALLLATLIIGTTAASFIFGGAVSPVSLLFGWTVGLVVITAYVLVIRRQQGHFPALNLRNEILLPLPYVLLLGVAAALTIDLVIAIIGGFHVTPALTCVGGDFNSSSVWFEWLLAAVFIILVQPVAEGLVFMGVLLPRLRASMGAVNGILATGVLFGVFHALVYGATLTGGTMLWYGFVMPLLTGLFLAAVRVYTDSTRAAIIAQVGMGMILLLAALLLTGNAAGCQFVPLS
jgi:membrane protease YdiL (CAAX protease family)